MNIQTKLQKVTCPCCGGFMGELPDLTKVSETMPGRMRKAFDLVVASGSEGIDRVSLSVALFGDRVGSSESKIAHTGTLVSNIRRAVEPFGYYIPRNKALHRGKYRLLPMEVGR